MRDAVIDEITVRGRAKPPAIVVNRIRGFLQRLPLPRLLDFVDLVLPQMVPVCSPAQSAGSKPGSQFIRDLWIDRDRGAFVQEPEVLLMRMFHSHAGILSTSKLTGTIIPSSSLPTWKQLTICERMAISAS